MFWIVAYALLLAVSILLFKFFPSSKIVRILVVICATSVFINGFISGFSFVENVNNMAKIVKGFFVGITSLSIYALFIFSMISLRANEVELNKFLKNITNRQNKE